MMAVITIQDLRELLDQYTGRELVLSCYADLGVSGGFRRDWQGLLKARSDAFEKALSGDGRARQELDANVDAVRLALESPDLHGVRWVAVFSAAGKNRLRVIPLDVPVETDLVLDRSPYLVPLLKSAAQRREFLAVHTDTHRGRLYAATPGDARLLDELDADVPKKQHSGGGLLGYGQPGITRHREDRILHYRKDLGQVIEHHWNEGSFAGLILLGEHEVLEHVRRELPPRLADRVVVEAPESWYEKPTQVAAKVRSLVADRYAAETGLTGEIEDRLRTGKAVATGADAVLAALQGGQVGPDGYGSLLFGPDPREAVARCVTCKTLTMNVTGPCPRCQSACLPGNLWEELLLTALQHRIAVQFVKDGKLAAHGGVVAMLPKAGVR